MTPQERTDKLQNLMRAYALGLMDRSNCVALYNPYPVRTPEHRLYNDGWQIMPASREVVNWSIVALGLDRSQPMDLQCWPHKITSLPDATKTHTALGRLITKFMNGLGTTPRRN